MTCDACDDEGVVVLGTGAQADFFPCPVCMAGEQWLGHLAGLHREHALTLLRDHHPATEACPVGECMACAVRDCPSWEPLHHDKDGCPACVGGITPS